MSVFRAVLYSGVSISILLFSVSFTFYSPPLYSQDTYFNTSTCAQSSCHDYLNAVPSADPDGKDVTSPMPKTCNGCHAHGTQFDTLGGDNQNLLAQTRLFEYEEGDTIYVDFNGGNRRWRQGWVKTTLYDENGNVLDSNTGCMPDNSRCEMPQALAVPATPELKRLFVGW